LNTSDRKRVDAFLHRLRRAGLLKAVRPPNVLRKRATLFDPREVARFVDGRTLLEVARQPFNELLAKAQSNENTTDGPSGGSRKKGKRGPGKKPSTRELEAYCYRRRMAGDKLSAIAASVREIFGRMKFNDAQVSIYARRHSPDEANIAEKA
jgi:hypothetical protein